MSCNYFTVTSCKHNCCDYYGYCPAYSYQCATYYNSSWAVGAIIGLIIGIICFIVFVVLVVYLCRRWRESRALPPPIVAPPQTEVYVIDRNNPHQG